MRKIIQIATGGQTEEDHMLYALCDDGTVWFQIAKHDMESGVTLEWRQDIPIPQDAPSKNEPSKEGHVRVQCPACEEKDGRHLVGCYGYFKGGSS